MQRKTMRILCILSIIFALLAVSVNAAKAEEIKAAEMLYELGLFRGTDEGYALDKTVTRAEAVTMIVRFWGAEEQALEQNNAHPFNDVPQWASPYIGYAYKNSITYGVSETEFLPNEEMSEKQFYTLLLRLLGYDDLAGDFVWNASEALAGQVGLLRGLPESAAPFLRGTMVRVCKNALSAKGKESGMTLAQELIEKGVFTEAEYKKAQKSGSTTSSGTTKPSSGTTAKTWTTTVTNETADLTASNVFVLTGEAIDSKTLEIALTLDGAVELCGFDFRLRYDPERFVLQELNSEYDLQIVSDTESTEGEIAFNYAGANNIKKTKQILTATFTVLGAEGSDEISLDTVEVTRVGEDYEVTSAPYTLTAVTVNVK